MHVDASANPISSTSFEPPPRYVLQSMRSTSGASDGDRHRVPGCSLNVQWSTSGRVPDDAELRPLLQGRAPKQRVESDERRWIDPEVERWQQRVPAFQPAHGSCPAVCRCSGFFVVYPRRGNCNVPNAVMSAGRSRHPGRRLPIEPVALTESPRSDSDRRARAAYALATHRQTRSVTAERRNEPPIQRDRTCVGIGKQARGVRPSCRSKGSPEIKCRIAIVHLQRLGRLTPCRSAASGRTRCSLCLDPPAARPLDSGWSGSLSLNSLAAAGGLHRARSPSLLHDQERQQQVPGKPKMNARTRQPCSRCPGPACRHMRVRQHRVAGDSTVANHCGVSSAEAVPGTTMSHTLERTSLIRPMPAPDLSRLPNVRGSDAARSACHCAPSVQPPVRRRALLRGSNHFGRPPDEWGVIVRKRQVRFQPCQDRRRSGGPMGEGQSRRVRAS